MIPGYRSSDERRPVRGLRELPVDIEAENALIGAMLLSNTAFLKSIDRVKASDFYEDTYATIFEAMRNIHTRGGAVDLVTMKSELQRMQKLERVGGTRTLLEARETVPSAKNVEHYIEQVLNTSGKRQMIDLGSALHSDGTNPALSAAEVIARAAEKFQKVSSDSRAIEKVSRVLLGRGMMEGIEPPEEMEPDILLRGKVHSLYAAPGAGKTFVSLWLSARAIERNETVLLLDSENGERIISERLGDLGVDPARVDEYLHYYPYPALTLSTDDRQRYKALLDAAQPDLVVFDSLLNSLALSGLDENSSNDVARWATAYTRPARERGITVVILDHVPHGGDHARGSTRKKDEVDVMWRLKRSQPFDRDHVGEIVLHRDKDREGWLPMSVTFSVGGSPEGFVFSHSSGTVEDRQQPHELLRTERSALDALRECGAEGATDARWKKAADMEPHGLSRSTYYRAKKELLDRGLVVDESGVFHAADVTPRFEVVPQASVV